MNETHDINQTTTADNGDGLDPQDAATLIEQTRQQTRRQFEVYPPLLWATIATVSLVSYGAIWLSVLGHHPYKGPSAVALIVVYALAAVVIRVVITIRKRATGGISGRSQQLRRAQIAAVAVPYAAVYFFMDALLHAGASHAIVYGLYPATMPLIVVGGVVAGLAAARADWPVLGTAAAVVAVGAGAAFAGPIGAWAVAGVGLFVVLLGYAAATAWLHRA